MRFMVIVKADRNSEAGVLPDKKIFEEMGKYNEELVKAGVMLSAEGLQARAKGARVKFDGAKRTVTDSPMISSSLTRARASRRSESRSLRLRPRTSSTTS